ncbi:DegT/DnrJ/EryC1/StrS family aminotransferase [Thermodesulfobacteriota bacterium]
MDNQWRIPWSGRSHDLNPEDIDFLNDVIRCADPLTQGKHLALFEEKLKAYISPDKGKVFGLSSATAALELIAAFLNLSEKDEVIVPAHTFTASALPFLRRKARIVWADIDPETWVISFDDVCSKLTDKTKAIVLVHLYGVPADMDSFCELAGDRKIFLIEDAAQAFGASYKGLKIGSFGDFSAYSFHAQKNMTTLGEGGALFVKDEDYAEKVPALRSFGATPFGDREYYWKPAMGNLTSVLDWELPHKFTITEIQCAIGHKLLDQVDTLNKKRKARFCEFRNRLAAFPELKFQEITPSAESSYHLMPAKYLGSSLGIQATRDELIKALAFTYKIQTIVQYYPLYRYDLYQEWGCGEANCPNTDDLFDNMISFPFHVWMNDDDFQYMMESTIEALKSLREVGS